MENRVIEASEIVGTKIYLLKYSSLDTNSLVTGILGIYATETRAVNVMVELTKTLALQGFQESRKRRLETIMLNECLEERRIFVEEAQIS